MEVITADPDDPGEMTPRERRHLEQMRRLTIHDQQVLDGAIELSVTLPEAPREKFNAFLKFSAHLLNRERRRADKAERTLARVKREHPEAFISGGDDAHRG